MKGELSCSRSKTPGTEEHSHYSSRKLDYIVGSPKSTLRLRIG